MARALIASLLAILTGSAAAAQPGPRQEGPLAPAESLSRFQLANDLEIELVLSEPEISQPLFLNFDARGRMWVVEYRQYPKPAGLEVVSHDTFWRTVYNKVPPPPPAHDKGGDRITIHEDTNSDGTFDSHKVFLDGLNIATAVESGRGGVWVLNPPYLLFYPDADGDDVPDGPPIVHLAGFGLEDTHSVANSLRWGPDGWLYGAQGSTVTGHMMRPGLDKEPILHTMGQGIWRYQPQSRKFEFFSEGGGNTFGVELDSKGRIFSGHNGGDTRGFHYVQGGYLRKGFEKHGPLSNPYAFGFFEPMAHHKAERFTHNFVIYEGGALPSDYWGRLLGIEPLQGRLVSSEFQPERSTFRTRDLARPLTSSDAWFRPVDIKTGPDGAIYLCDWYDGQIAHFRSADGEMEKKLGRIYRLKNKGAKPAAAFDLGNATSMQLAETLWHPNKWFRQTALRLLGDRRDPSVIPALLERMETGERQLALEALWAVYASGGLNPAIFARAIAHRDAQVRLWAARLLCDENAATPAQIAMLVQLAHSETDIESRIQLAASARRLPAPDCLAIVRELLRHDEDAADPRQPLMLWWALESKAATDRDALLAFFSDTTLWDRAIVRQHLLSLLIRRFAQSGTRPELLACARLFQLSPTLESSRLLMSGFEAAFKGRSLAGLPMELLNAMNRHRAGSPALALRLGEPGAFEKALACIADEGAPATERLAFLQVLGEIEHQDAAPTLLELIGRASNEELRQAALAALQRDSHPETAARVIALYPKLPAASRAAAQTLLTSRDAWSLQFLNAVADGTIRDTAPGMIRGLKSHSIKEIAERALQLWPATGKSTTLEMEQTIRRLALVARSGSGDPYSGQTLFSTGCAACHSFFSQGGRVGPDLTSFHRDDIETMLLHIVNPNAEIREGYENVMIRTLDGRSLAGFVTDADDKTVVLRGLDGQTAALARSEISTFQPSGVSLMPEGLLAAFSEQQVRDLFAYLRITQPLVAKPSAAKPVAN